MTSEQIAVHPPKQSPARLLTQKLPIVQLKEGISDDLLSFRARKGHSIVEFNNLRANYHNYCHYRRPFSRTHLLQSDHKNCKNLGHKSDYSLLNTSLKLPKRTQSRPNTPILPHDSNDGTKSPTTSHQKATRVTSGIKGYELKGTTMVHRNHSARPDTLLRTFIAENAAQQEDGARPVTADRIYGLRCNDACNKSPYKKYLKNVENSVDDYSTKPVFDRKSLRMLVHGPSKSLSRRVTFKGDDSGLVTAYTIEPHPEENLRIDFMQNLMILTEQNLEIFNRINERQFVSSRGATDSPSNKCPGTSERVLQWVLERSRVNDEVSSRDHILGSPRDGTDVDFQTTSSHVSKE